MKMTNFWRGLAQDIVETQNFASVLDATEALAPKSLEAVDVPVDVAIYTHVYNVHGDYIDSIEGGEGLKASEIHFLPFTQPAEMLRPLLPMLISALENPSFMTFVENGGLTNMQATVENFYQSIPEAIPTPFQLGALLQSAGVDLSITEFSALNQLEIQDYYSLLDFYKGPRAGLKTTSFASKVRSHSAFYISANTMAALREVYSRPGVEEREYGGIMYVSTNGELLLEECAGCTGDENSLKGIRFSSNYIIYPNAGNYVASWHTHPPSASESRAFVPSGAVAGSECDPGKCDVGSFMLDTTPSGDPVPKSERPSGVNNSFAWSPKSEPRRVFIKDQVVFKTYRIYGGFGVILSKNHLTVYRHKGHQLTRPPGSGPNEYLLYGRVDYYDAYGSDSVGYVAYDIQGLNLEHIY